MESEEEFSNPESYQSQNSDSLCPSLHNSSNCNNGFSSLNETNDPNKSLDPGSTVRRSASGVLRCSKEDNYYETENLLSNEVLHSVLQSDLAYDNGSLFRDDNDPFEG